MELLGEKMKLSYKEVINSSGITVGELIDAINTLVQVTHQQSIEGGWWTDLYTGEPLTRNIPEMLCLIHSEISEAMEGHRKNLYDDKLPGYKMFDVELADALIRIGDLLGGKGTDNPGEVLASKVLFNKHRADHKPENRKGENGKKF